MGTAGANPAVLRWARQRAGLTLEDATKALKSQNWSKHLPAWESEELEKQPTFEQVRALSKLYNAPLATLFLDAPVDESLKVPDLRTVGDHPAEMSVNLRDVLMSAQRKQEWARSMRRRLELGKVEFVGQGSTVPRAEALARMIEKALGLTREMRVESADARRYHLQLVRRAEAVGVIVIRSSVVGNRWRRQLDIEEFRGFALSDSIAPLVFINTADFPSAQSFTLVHELAHLAINESGISNASLYSSGSSAGHEAFCNAVAAEVLAPIKEFTAAWDSAADLPTNAAILAGRFKVGQMVIARRAFDEDLIKGGEYWPFVKARVEAARKLRAAERKKSREKPDGPGYYKLVRSRNGALVDAVIHAAISGAVLYREAANLLEIPHSGIDHLARGRS